MRYLAILGVLALVYFFFLRPKLAPFGGQPHLEQVVRTGSANVDFLKRPLDRAHDALNANNKRVSDEP